MTVRKRTPDLVVAVHDVMDTTVPQIRQVLWDLDRIGVHRRTLLVVPRRAGTLRESGSLRALLEEQAGGGCELVAHGWTHRAPSRVRGPFSTRARAHLFARGIAEFASLGSDDAMLAAGMARRELALAGFSVEGFCAPGWLEAPWLPDALRAAGYRFSVGMASVTDLQHQRRRRLGWSGYVGAGPAQEFLVAGTSRTLAAMPGRPSATQVFLHPQGDLSGSFYRAAVRRVERLVHEGSRVVRFCDLLE
ncbi:MAG: DUF2334 domain-containing protein [Candidatus Dormibacteraceae bacterium]